MEGFFASMITLCIFIIPMMLFWVIRPHNKMVMDGTYHTFDCSCGYQGDHEDELVNHITLTGHERLMLEKVE